MNRNRKVLLIGLDGATFDLLMPWIKKGKLPTLQKLMSKGVYGNLQSTVPTVSAAAWTSLVTGKNPGKHGIFNFVTKEGKLINSTHIKSKKIWEILSDHGLDCCIVNVPVTYPPDKIKGYMISSFLTPPNRNDFVYPPSLMRTITRNKYRIDIEFERYGVFPKDVERKIKDLRWEILPEIYDILEKRCNTLRELIGMREWDFFMIVFKETDVMQHIFWDQKKELLRFYETLDNRIKELIDQFKSTCCKHADDVIIFILSDHGFGKDCEKAFNVRGWQKKQGIKDLNESTLFGLYRRSYRALERIFGEANVYKILKKIAHVTSTSSIFQPKKIKIGMHGIYINKKYSTEKKYETARDNLLTSLKKAKDPGGKPIFIGIWKREDLFNGPYIHQLPDIVYRSQPEYIVLDKEDSEIFQSYNGIPGGHLSHPNGIIIASGSLVKTGGKLDKAHIFDVVPTLLYFLSLPTSDDFDGKVLTELFKHELKKRYDQSVDTHTTKAKRKEIESEEIRARLKALGYLN